MPRIGNAHSKVKDKADPRNTGHDKATGAPRPAWMGNPDMLPKTPPPLPGRPPRTARKDVGQ